MLKSVRWKIGGLMFLGVAYNYLDRVNISHAIIYIAEELSITNIEKGYILSSFSLGYVLFMPFGGLLVYKYGARFSLFFSGLLLSFVTILTGFSNNFNSLLLNRFFTGIFEAPIFPANAFIVSKWFPKRERNKAISLFDSGSYIGAAVAAPIVIFLIVKYNWRVSFYITGIIGIIWSCIWVLYYRDKPSNHLKIKHDELLLINHDARTDKTNKIEFNKYLKNKKILGISLGFFCYNYLKSFHLTWFPVYLVETKDLNFVDLSYAAFLPSFMAIISELFVGHIMDKSIERGISPILVKKIPICFGLIFSSIIVFSIFTKSIIIVIMLTTLSYMFLISASVGIWSIPDDLAQNKREVALIGSIQNTFSNIAGIIAPIITGYLYHYSENFLIPFIVSCAISLVGAFSYWYVVGDLKPIKI